MYLFDLPEFLVNLWLFEGPGHSKLRPTAAAAAMAAVTAMTAMVMVVVVVVTMAILAHDHTLLEGTFQEGALQEGTLLESPLKECTHPGGYPPGGYPPGGYPRGVYFEGRCAPGTLQEGTLQEGTVHEGTLQEGTLQEGTLQEDYGLEKHLNIKRLRRCRLGDGLLWAPHEAHLFPNCKIPLRMPGNKIHCASCFLFREMIARMSTVCEMPLAAPLYDRSASRWLPH